MSHKSKKTNYLCWRTAYFLCSALFLTNTVSADISGTVYRDLPMTGTTLNTYGVKDANEPGVAGVTVTATDANGAAIGSPVTTNINGEWSITGTTGDIRVSFSDIPAGLFSSPSNTDSATTVQFVSDGDNNVNLGLHYPTEFNNATDPLIVTPVLINGDPLKGGTSAAQGALITTNVYSSGQQNNHQNIALHQDIGSTWGTAYDANKQYVYVAALAKRHVGFGPAGPMGIYILDVSDPNAATSVGHWDLSSVLPTTADPRAANDLPAGLTSPSHDTDMFSLVGTMAFGDIDVSADGKTLWVMNLTDRALYEIDISGSPATITADRVTKHSQGLDPGCSDGDYRPWAIALHGNDVYAGVVCSAETSQNQADLSAHVMKLAGNSFSSVLEWPLNYTRGCSTTHASFTHTCGWYPWNNTWSDFFAPYQTYIIRAMPMFTDINIDIDGSLVMSFADRSGHQIGYFNYQPASTDTTLYRAIIAGDLVRAYYNADQGIFELEDNGKEGPSSTKPATASANNGEGLGGGEFYDDRFKGHQEIGQGGAALLAGSDTYILTGIDPLQYNSGGIFKFSNTTGISVEAERYEIYSGNNTTTGTMGKSNGLGDIEILSPPAPLEIGNRVWNDSNSNGLQDAGEPGIDGVQVTLNCGGSDTTQTTANGGLYLFTDGNVSGGIPRDTQCTISVPTNFNGQQLTSQRADMDEPLGSNPDPSSGTFSFRTGMAGNNNHTYDIGYISTLIDLELNKEVTPTSGNPGDTVTYTITVSNTGQADANSVQVSDKLPNGVTYLPNHVASQGTYDPITGIWDVGGIPQGGAVTLTLNATVN